ncbi:hypothetical protein Sme01_68660 [Sphaerisporangium melleum]|uniref:DUF6458 domain-containing protein n=1 Tax=Sphaerisporangium melleum TaxID=321316 RepID=A0A917VTB5_9ACTN|nr:DUF6458 family protein [Sphaerisporangium melleum]GGL12134.1 hypothetical protein GCM10007964_62690 [Sphaerisporangium melleum]GII74390.1 hypothetical protein Sme01_68660 [Sphaerisporangium melleum]
MTIAGSIFLIMLGAILTWAVEFDLAGVDINVVGVILMLGGIAGLLFGIWRLTNVRRTAVTRATAVDDPMHPVAPVETARTRVYEERRYDDPMV